jgi:hypothetical protein
LIFILPAELTHEKLTLLEGMEIPIELEAQASELPRNRPASAC